VAAATTGIHASSHGRTLVVTMTNDQTSNQIEVYDAESHALLQTLPTHGKGGVGGNARGIKQYDVRLVAVVNNGSGNVALFRRDGVGQAHAPSTRVVGLEPVATGHGSAGR